MRNVARLTRAAIDSSGGKDVPSNGWSENEHTSAFNGTTVKITGIATIKINTQAIMEYIERHLQSVSGLCCQKVAVNRGMYANTKERSWTRFLPSIQSPEQQRILGPSSAST